MKNIIRNYINKLKIEDVDNYLKSNNITISNDELSIIYYYLKEKWEDFLYKDATPILNDLKYIISEPNYDKLYNLYLEAKEKYSNYL